MSWIFESNHVRTALHSLDKRNEGLQVHQLSQAKSFLSLEFQTNSWRYRMCKVRILEKADLSSLQDPLFPLTHVHMQDQFLQGKLLLRMPVEVSIPARAGTHDWGYLASDEVETVSYLQGKLPEL